MPTHWLTKIQPIRANLRAAGGTAFTVEVVVRLQAGIREQVKTAIFGVAPKLASKTIPETAFIDKIIKRIEKKKQQVVPNSGHIVAIVENFEVKSAVQSLNDAKKRAKTPLRRGRRR